LSPPFAVQPKPNQQNSKSKGATNLRKRDSVELAGHLPPIIAPAVLAALGAGAQSRSFTSAMGGAGGSTPLVDALYTVAPTAYALNDPNDPRNQPVTQSRPPSPLDKLNPPPPVNPPQPAYSP
jgi:hypothetical protein